MIPIVERTDPRGPGAAALLAESRGLMQGLFPPEENHFLTGDALAAPGMHVFAARLGRDTVGIVALAERDGYGEVKSLYVAPSARGTGTATALLAALEDCARTLGLPLLRLETGDALTAALAFYRRHGFTLRSAFGGYRAGASSIFLEKPLDA